MAKANTRDKLIELLMDMPSGNSTYEEEERHIESVADYLIENGVTFATDNNVGCKWIPVTERLPELHTKVLCCGKKGGRFIAELCAWGKENHLHWDKKNGQGCPTVTHWMPLPEPPKE